MKSVDVLYMFENKLNNFFPNLDFCHLELGLPVKPANGLGKGSADEIGKLSKDLRIAWYFESKAR